MLELIHVSSGGGYDWRDLVVWVRADDNGTEYAVDYQSGCSCFSYEESREGELHWIRSIAEVRRQFASCLECGWDSADRAEAESKLRLLQPMR